MKSLPYLKRLTAIKGPGIGRLKPPRQPMPSVTDGMDDIEKRAYYDLCGDPKKRADIAKRYRALLDRYPSITLPEAIVYFLLEKRNEIFTYQEAALGGRGFLGGIVVDFLVQSRGYGLALQVQGDYWHTVPGARERDFAVIRELIGSSINGFTILYVVELWESTLLGCNRETAIDLALQGQGVGRDF